MQIDLYALSQQLLEALANSIHDREPKNLNPFFFNIAEVHVTERWLEEIIVNIRAELLLSEFINDVNKDCD